MARTSLGQARTRLPLFKHCIDCKQTLPAADFHQYKYVTNQQKQSERLHSRCKECHNLRKRERLVENRARSGFAPPRHRARPIPGAIKAVDFLKPFVSEKRCSKCDETKPREQFYPHPRTSDGLRSACKGCQHKANNLYQRANPEKYSLWQRRASIKKKYGITYEHYQRLVAEQDGRCASCKQTPKTPLCVDHDHQTGRVRGLLCTACNVALGNLRENRDIVLALVRYIDERC